MTNEEKILDILAMMQAEMKGMEHRLQQDMCDFETRINIKIEHEVTGKIEALFDGYKLTHEKQWELERRVNDLERRLAEIDALLQAG